MVDVLIFEGNEAKVPEEMLLQARHAALRDSLISWRPYRVAHHPGNKPAAISSLCLLPKVPELNKIPPRAPLRPHLIDLIERYRVRTVLCMGAAVPLITGRTAVVMPAGLK